MRLPLDLGGGVRGVGVWVRECVCVCVCVYLGWGGVCVCVCWGEQILGVKVKGRE